VSIEIGEPLGGFFAGFLIVFLCVVIAEALPSPQIPSSPGYLVLFGFAFGFVVPIILFLSDIGDAVRAGLGYCLGLISGGVYWMMYVSFSWYAVQMIMEGIFGMMIWIWRRV
jgi:hypothetical protein